MRKSICQVSCWMKDSILLHYSPYFYQSSCSKELKEVFEWIYCVLGVYIIQFNHSPPPSRKLIFSAVSEARVSAANARRAKTAGVWVQKKGCPLPLGKNIFVFWTSLDAFLDHFITIFTLLFIIFPHLLSFIFPQQPFPPGIIFFKILSLFPVLLFCPHSIFLHFFPSSFPLKELYTSETTLAQKIVLTPLNNKFVLKIRYLTPIMQKRSANIFGQNLKSDLLSGLSVMVYKIKIS